ncbi:lysine histidine transporter-like 8 [Pistacia vera]|uniref:lysine histidine transporter-like 8 n=1 Tax=Pistacia vera TaxID=55513 RepID=UPI001263C4A3|nr:lysine histidine transporter-like 8 [Pistacia vera]
MGEVADGSCVEELDIHNQTISKSAQQDHQQVVTINESTTETQCTRSYSTASLGINDEVVLNPQPQDTWLPITESRNGNVCSSVFHLISSGIGFQALSLPIALATLGWTWGIISLSLAYTWQLYTIWLLVQLAESVPGTRYSRYLHLSIAAFGPKLGKLLALFPVMYLSGGSCVMLIITAGGYMETFYKILSGDEAMSFSGILCFLVFTYIAITIAQLPNLNSITKVSMLGAITGIASSTLIWALPISKGKPSGVSYQPTEMGESGMVKFGGIFNAIGIIVLAFRGHNLVLEIQGTLPSNQNHKSSKPMWRGVIISYLIIAMCLFPLAIAGFWAYGNQIQTNGGMLQAYLQVHGDNTSKYVMGLIYLLVLINCLTTFNIYAIPVFDNLEMRYTLVKKKRCPDWVRVGFRLFFGGLAFFLAVAFPFLKSLSALIGGIAFPLTYVYPCFMYIFIKKTRSNGAIWCINLGLGCLGTILSVLLVVAALWNLATKGLNANFFRP